MKVFCGVKNYTNWLKDVQLVDKIEEADLVIFTGGEDINPALYGEMEVGKQTGINIQRDKEEEVLFRVALELGIPMLGICRGGQFLNAMSGGKMIQHVTGHGGTHTIKTSDGKFFVISSTHHQMMYPYHLKEGEDFELIAYSAEVRSNTYLNGKDEEWVDEETGLTLVEGGLAEPEIIFYPKTRCLCIQGHPEFSAIPEATIDYLRKLVEDKLLILVDAE